MADPNIIHNSGLYNQDFWGEVQLSDTTEYSLLNPRSPLLDPGGYFLYKHFYLVTRDAEYGERFELSQRDLRQTRASDANDISAF